MNAWGATWLDRQLLAKESAIGGSGFGAEVRDTMDRRVDHLIEEGLARRQGQRVIFARDLLNTLRRRELDDAVAKLSTETRLGFQIVPWRPALEQKLGQHVSGTLTPGGGVDWSLGRNRGLGI